MHCVTCVQCDSCSTERRPGSLTGGLPHDGAFGTPVAREMRAARDMCVVPDMPTFDVQSHAFPVANAVKFWEWIVGEPSQMRLLVSSLYCL